MFTLSKKANPPTVYVRSRQIKGVLRVEQKTSWHMIHQVQEIKKPHGWPYTSQFVAGWWLHCFNLMIPCFTDRRKFRSQTSDNMDRWKAEMGRVREEKRREERISLWTLKRRLRGRRKGLCTLSKVSKPWGFCSISKNDGRRGTFEEDLQRCIFRGRRSTRDMFIRAVRRSGRWFPETGCILEHQIFRFAEMILRDRCSTSPGITFSWQAQYFRQVEWKNRKTHWYEAVSSALNFPFLKEASQNCFVFDVVKFKNWGSLAGLFRFWRCQVQ